MSKGLSPLKLGYAPQRHLPFGQNKQLSVSTATGRAYNIRGAHHV